jgi:phage tail-like protein
MAVNKSDQQMNNSDKHFLNYVTANRFYVEIASSIAASFSECSGLSVKVKYEKVLEGGLNTQQRILLGQPEYSDVTLKRGLTDDLAFWSWVSHSIGASQNSSASRAGVNGSTSQESQNRRRNVNILLFNQAGETMQCWTLIGAVPVGWKAPALQANSTTVAIEELTLAYEGLQISKSNGGGASPLHNRDNVGFFASY